VFFHGRTGGNVLSAEDIARAVREKERERA